MSTSLVSHLGKAVHLKGTSGRESESLEDDMHIISCPFFVCEGLAGAGGPSVAGAPTLEVVGVKSAVILVTFDGIVWAASVIFLFFADECGPDS